MSANRLPAQFEHLQPYVEAWALASERDRYHKLHTTSMDELHRFYSAVLPEMEAILEYLKSQPLEGMPEEAQTLFHLAMTFAETAHPVDLNWRDVDFPSAYPWDRLEFRTVSLER